LERAQLVWQHACQLADSGGQLDAAAVELLATAHHDLTAMAHALSLGQTHLRHHDQDSAARHGVKLLEQAIEFLGVRPHHDRRRA
jgi:hypothetical protein